MTFIAGATVGQLRSPWTGVAGAPYYTGMSIDGDATDTGDYAEYVTQFWTAIADILSNEVTVKVDDSHPVFDISTGTTVGVSTSSEAAVVGTNAEEELATLLQVRVNLLTGEFVNGRELRGGFYIPALCESANDNGALHADVVATILVFLQDLYFDAAGFNGAGAVWSRTHGVAAYVTGFTVKPDFSFLTTRRP
jgi:hypothetical protein